MQPTETLNTAEDMKNNHPNEKLGCCGRVKLSFSGAFPTITINGQAHSLEPDADSLVKSTEKGYCSINRSWGKGALLVRPSPAMIPLVSKRGEKDGKYES